MGNRSYTKKVQNPATSLEIRDFLM